MNSITKFNELIPSQIVQKTRREGYNSAMKASAACIARREDDGGRTSVSAGRRQSLAPNTANADARRSVPPIASPLMTFALSFWRHAAGETFLPSCRKAPEGIDGFGWNETRLRSSERNRIGKAIT